MREEVTQMQLAILQARRTAAFLAAVLAAALLTAGPAAPAGGAQVSAAHACPPAC